MVSKHSKNIVSALKDGRTVVVLGPDSMEFNLDHPIQLSSTNDLTIDQIVDADGNCVNPRYAKLVKQVKFVAAIAAQTPDAQIVFKASLEKGNRAYVSVTKKHQKDRLRYDGLPSDVEGYIVGHLLTKHYGLPFMSDPQTVESVQASKDYLDAIQIPADQAKLNRNVVAAILNCFDPETGEFNKMFFAKLPPSFTDKQIQGLMTKVQDVREEVYAKLKAKNPAWQPPTDDFMPVVFVHRGVIMDASHEVIFAPGHVAPTVKKCGALLAVDCSHPTERYQDDEQVKKQILGNADQAITHGAAVIFSEISVEGDDALVDRDRALVLNTVEEGVSFVNNIVSRRNHLRQIPAEQRRKFGNFRTSSKNKKPNIIVITDKLGKDKLGNDRSRHPAPENAYDVNHHFKDVGQSTQSRLDMAAEFCREHGWNLGFYDISNFEKDKSLLSNLPPNSETIILMVGNRVNSCVELAKKLSERGYPLIMDQRDTHMLDPNSTAGVVQAKMHLYANVIMTNIDSINPLSQNIVAMNPRQSIHQAPALVATVADCLNSQKDTIIDPFSSLSKEGITRINFLQDCYPHHLSAIYPQVKQLSEWISYQNDIDVSYTILTRKPEPNSLEAATHGGAKTIDDLNGLNQLSSAHLNVLCLPYDRERHQNLLLSSFVQNHQANGILNIDLLSFNTGINLLGTGAYRAAQAAGFNIPAFAVGSTPHNSAWHKNNGVGYAQNLIELVQAVRSNLGSNLAPDQHAVSRLVHNYDASTANSQFGNIVNMLQVP